ncbi:hypothetical protein XENORESO_015549 [Xenotaenia resolanae]|uniref:Uncharacterized protein n=1 Tax=Xenotaenia resolanae TaxID=208358 RepID=A0ABV0W3P5_9TELE
MVFFGWTPSVPLACLSDNGAGACNTGGLRRDWTVVTDLSWVLGMSVLAAMLLLLITCTIITTSNGASSASRKCENSLVSLLPNKAFNSSSEYGRGYGAAFAKLNRIQGMAVQC